MYEWKLVQFLKEHRKKFPHYTSLSIEECMAVERKIAGLVEKSEEENPVEILKPWMPWRTKPVLILAARSSACSRGKTISDHRYVSTGESSMKSMRCLSTI